MPAPVGVDVSGQTEQVVTLEEQVLDQPADPRCLGLPDTSARTTPWCLSPATRDPRREKPAVVTAGSYHPDEWFHAGSSETRDR